jgi:hypothetical protein
MCTYVTESAAISGSGKAGDGWFSLSRANVYVDHPYHTLLEHTLNIDFTGDGARPSARVAVELSVQSARDLVACIEAALAATTLGG